jgi:hypothetical protein
VSQANLDAAKRARLKAAAKSRRGGVTTATSGGGDPLGLGTLFGVPVTFVLVGAAVVAGVAIWRVRR